LLVHEKVAKDFLPKLVAKFDGKAAFRCDEASYQFVVDANAQAANKTDVTLATAEDFDTEFLDYILAIKTVSSVDEAIDFINEHNTKHSETIITKNTDNAKAFQAKVDASCVYVNASTRFTDGEMFGFGAELGISTQKMHVRGPMGLNALTTTKYLIDGDGQIR
jgi:glutamate-5-semialdehyde dehydrogenase